MSLSSGAILAYYLDKLKYRWPGSGSKGGDNGLNIHFLRVSDFGY